jgi:hypothetical protein
VLGAELMRTAMEIQAGVLHTMDDGCLSEVAVLQLLVHHLT